MSVKLRTPYVLTLLEVGSPPAAELGMIKLYASDAGGDVELFIRDADGNVSQITDGGTVSAGALVTSTGVVTISSSAAPSAGMSLVATSGTTATWQTVSSLQLTSTAPVAVDASAAALGVSTQAAKGDHKHSVSTGTPVGLTVGGANVPGSSNNLARADHTHSLPAYGSSANTIAEGNDSRFSNDRTASGVRTATTVVSVSGATAPVSGQALVATSSTNATWQNQTAAALSTTGAAVVVSTAAPPVASQVLTATSPTTAAWQTPSGGGGGGGGNGWSQFDMVRNNTGEASPDEIANLLYDPTVLGGASYLVAVLECAIAGQTCFLDLYNITDGGTVTTISTTSTSATKVMSAALSVPGGERLYGARLYRVGGSSGDHVVCRGVRFENI